MNTSEKVIIEAPEEILEKVILFEDSGYTDGYRDISKEKALELIKSKYPGRKVIKNTLSQLLGQIGLSNERFMELEFSGFGPSESERAKMKTIRDKSISIEISHPKARYTIKFLVLPAEEPVFVKSTDLDKSGLKYDKETGKISGMLFKDSPSAMSLMKKLNITKKEEFPAAWEIEAVGTII